MHGPSSKDPLDTAVQASRGNEEERGVLPLVKKYAQRWSGRVVIAGVAITLIFCVAALPNFDRIGGWGGIIGIAIGLLGLAGTIAAILDQREQANENAAAEKKEQENRAAADAAVQKAKREDRYWKDSVTLIKVLLSNAPIGFADEFADRIVANLETELKLRPDLFAAARRFVEARLLDAAKSDKRPIPMEGLTLDEAYQEVRDTIVTVLSTIQKPVKPEILKTCFDLNNLVDEDASAARQYFESLAKISAEGEKVDDPDRFLTPVEVTDGFVAPTYLVAGLLNQFKKTWGQALEKFPDALSNNPDLFELVQRFEFYCWLLWGPSIPACSCTRWDKGECLALQYGYGDENNSFPLLLDGQLLDSSWTDIKARLRRDEENLPLAVAGTLKGQIVWGPAYRPAAGNVPNIYSVSEDGGRHSILQGLALRATEPIQWRQSPSRYFSAYMWIMFEVCALDGTPMYSDSKERWKWLFPLFEHANTGEGKTLTYLKHQLAAKACAALKEFTGDGKTRLRYLCATDDPGGVQNQDGEHRIRFRFDTTEDAVLRNDSYGKGSLPSLEALAPADKNRLRNILASLIHDPDERTRIFEPNAYDPKEKLHFIITSCDLPQIIHDFYDYLKPT